MIKDKFSFYFFLSIPIVIALYIVFLWITYIDETVVVGKAYGFTIGQKMEDVYERAGSEFEYKDVSVWLVEGDSSPVVLSSFLFDSKSFNRLAEYDRWRFYLGDGFSDSFTLKFSSNNKLEEIHRHRQYFEIP